MVADISTWKKFQKEIILPSIPKKFSVHFEKLVSKGTRKSGHLTIGFAFNTLQNIKIRI